MRKHEAPLRQPLHADQVDDDATAHEYHRVNIDFDVSCVDGEPGAQAVITEEREVSHIYIYVYICCHG